MMLVGHHPELPVRGAMCFLGTELPWVEERVMGIPLVDVAGLRRLLSEPGDLDESTRGEVSASLAGCVAPA